jgi:hypothetical protein
MAAGKFHIRINIGEINNLQLISLVAHKRILQITPKNPLSRGITFYKFIKDLGHEGIIA